MATPLMAIVIAIGLVSACCYDGRLVFRDTVYHESFKAEKFNNKVA